MSVTVCKAVRAWWCATSPQRAPVAKASRCLRCDVLGASPLCADCREELATGERQEDGELDEAIITRLLEVPDAKT